MATDALLSAQATRGRRRRWVYAAAADEHAVVGVACVDVGVLGLGTAFAFAVDEGGVHLWDAGPGRAGHVGGLGRDARVRRRRATVDISDGSFTLDVPVAGGRLRAEITGAPLAPVSLVTPTPAGGWNATTKAAGHVATGSLVTPAGARRIDGLGWTDATDGRQDAHTTWRWAAGAGHAVGGPQRVGLQASTGMNGVAAGEDLAWWDDQPVPLTVESLGPVVEGAFDGAWELVGDGWGLRFEPSGIRAADEGIGPIRSRYVQPIGTWTGTLPGPDGTARPVELRGVTEDHEARW